MNTKYKIDGNRLNIKTSYSASNIPSTQRRCFRFETQQVSLT